MGRRLLIFVLFCLFLYLVVPFYGTNSYKVFGSSFTYVDSFWGSVDNPQRVYPGSRNVVLIIEVLNNNPYRIESIYGNISLPTGITNIYGDNYAVSTGYVSNGSYTRNYVKSGEVFRLRYVLNILDNVSPGVYYASINLTYTYINSSVLVTQSYILNDVKIVISDFPSFNFNIVDLFWTAGDELVNPTSPSRDLTLHIKVKNLGDESIDGLTGYLLLNPPFYPNRLSYNVENIAPGEVFELVYSGVDIDADYPSMNYYETLKMNFTFTGYGGAKKEYSKILSVSIQIYDPYYPSIQFYDFGWVGVDKVYPGSKGVYARITLINLGRFQVSNIHVEVYLPNCIKTQFGRKIINSTVGGVYGFGDFIDIDLGPLYVSDSINGGIYNATVIVSGVGNIGSSSIIVRQNLSIPIIINEYTSDFDLIDYEWIYSGGAALPVPGSKNIVLAVDFLYKGEEDIFGLSPSINSSDGFILKGVNIDQENIAPGTRFRITFTFDISRNISPGNYIMNLSLRYVVSPNNINSVKSFNTRFVVYVLDPTLFASNVELIESHWGSGEPVNVYPLSENNVLSITIFNEGPYDINGVYASIALPMGMSSKSLNTSISPNIPVGAFQTGVFYIDIGNVDPGNYIASLIIRFSVSIYGAELNFSRDIDINLYVSPPPLSSSYLELTQYEWLNGYPVYPDTDNAVLVLTFASYAPYPVNSLTFRLVGDRDVKFVDGVNSVYVEGPVPSYGSFSVNMPINISSSAHPGYHNITIGVTYLLMSGGDGVKVTEYFSLNVYIDDLSGIDYLGYFWQGESPGPGGSATLNIVYLNNIYDSMDGVYATLRFPPGFMSLYSNSSTLNITPYILTSVSDINQLLSNPALLSNLPVGQGNEVSKGDYIIFSAPVRILNSTKVGEYILNISLHFIDVWGVERVIRDLVNFSIFGKTGYIVVNESMSRIILGERVSNVSITIENPGSGELYDIYVSIYSVNQLVAFSSSVKHLDYLPPGGKATLTWRASISPESSIAGGIPAIVYILYTDPIGNRASINQTVILYIEGMPKLKLIDISISPSPAYVNDTVSISATLVDVGDATAKNVEVEVVGNGLVLGSDSHTFLGDIEEGSQIPFTVYFGVGSKVGEVSGILRVRYFNVFNEEIDLEYPFRVSVIERPVEGGGGGGLLAYLFEDIWRVYAIAVTAIFIIISLYLIYRVYVVSKRVSGGVP